MNPAATPSLTQAFVFPFRGKDWGLKLLVAFVLSVLGALLLFIPSIFVLGYLARLMRRVINGGAPELPGWYDWGQLFISGLKVFAGGLVFSLPSLLLIGVGYAGVLWPAFSPAFSQSGQVEDTAALLILGGSFGGMCLVGAGLLVWLATLLALPVAVTHLVAENSFAAAFDVRAWWRVLRANLGGFMLALLLVLGLTTLMYFAYSILLLTIVLCFLAPFLALLSSIYVLLVGGALYAGAYLEGVNRLTGMNPILNLETGDTSLEASI